MKRCKDKLKNHDKTEQVPKVVTNQSSGKMDSMYRIITTMHILVRLAQKNTFKQNLSSKNTLKGCKLSYRY